MITKIRERIAEERICAFLESMSQLGFTQEQVLGLIQREERGEERMRQDNDLVVCQGLTSGSAARRPWTVWTWKFARANSSAFWAQREWKTTRIKLINGC